MARTGPLAALALTAREQQTPHGPDWESKARTPRSEAESRSGRSLERLLLPDRQSERGERVQRREASLRHAGKPQGTPIRGGPVGGILMPPTSAAYLGGSAIHSPRAAMRSSGESCSRLASNQRAASSRRLARTRAR